MPRTSNRIADEPREMSTTAAESVVPRLSGTFAGMHRLLRGFPDRVRFSASTIAVPAAHSPAPKRARAGPYATLPKDSVRPEKLPSHPAVEAETSPGIVQTHG